MNPEFHSYFPEDIFSAKLNKFKLKLLESRAEKMMSDFCGQYRACLALSFGKDSMTMLHILQKKGIKPEIIMFNHSGIETEDTEKMIEYVKDYYGISNFVCTKPDEKILHESLQKTDIQSKNPMKEFTYNCLEKPRWEAMDRHSINGCILGLRADESKGRKTNYLIRGDNYFNKREHNQILTPMIEWKTEDIFAYAAMENIPFHPVYQKKARYKEKKFIRHNTPLSLDFLHDGDMMFLKTEYPKTYQKYLSVCPFIRDLI